MKTYSSLAIAIIACFAISGCGDTSSEKPSTKQSHDDHSHSHAHDHDGGGGHHETFAEAVADITAKRDAVQAAMEKDDLKTADGPVHAIGHVLEELEGLATKQGLKGDQLTEVTTARDALFEAFAGLDQTIHGKEDGKSWSDVAESINAAVGKLQALTEDSPTEEEPAPADEVPTPAEEEAPAEEKAAS